MAYAAVTFLLENLSNILISSADLVSGAEDEIQLLRNEVEPLKVLLLDTANKTKKEESFTELARQILEVVDDVHDTIDSCLSQAAGAQSKIKLRITEPTGSLAEEVRSLRENKVKPMLEKARMVDFAEMLRIGDGSVTNVLEEPHRIKVNQVLPIGQYRSVGLEGERKKIIGYLREETEELDFILIIGMAGLGKTTLARQIFRSPEIQYVFPTRIWVYVSQDFNRRDVFLNILKEVTSKDMSSVSDDELAVVVHDFLEKRRFLLVLDDVWSPGDVSAIRDALPKSSKRMSKVLITSRFREVGTHANLKMCRHYLRYLTRDESWELLQLQVFGVLDGCSVELMEIGKHIARNCGGLPIAIVIAGGILLDQLLKTQSMNALKIKWIKLSASIGFERSHERTEILVQLSYSSFFRTLCSRRSLFFVFQ